MNNVIMSNIIDSVLKESKLLSAGNNSAVDDLRFKARDEIFDLWDEWFDDNRRGIESVETVIGTLFYFTFPKSEAPITLPKNAFLRDCKKILNKLNQPNKFGHDTLTLLK